jgi:transcriptional regulator with XRE-family HTH domain
MELKDRIRAAREACGLSQRDLGVALGLDRATVANWERGHREPPVDTLLQLAEVLKVRLGVLLGETNYDPIEIALVQRFRAIDADHRRAFFTLVDRAAQECGKAPKSTEAVIHRRPVAGVHSANAPD